MLNSARGVICGVAFVSAPFSFSQHPTFLSLQNSIQSPIVHKPSSWLSLTFPGTSTAPPITTTSFTLANVSLSSSAANARFVSGPIATIVMLSASCSASVFKICLCAGSVLGLKFVWACSAARREAGVVTIEVARVSDMEEAEVKRVDQGEDGVRWGCWEVC